MVNASGQKENGAQQNWICQAPSWDVARGCFQGWRKPREVVVRHPLRLEQIEDEVYSDRAFIFAVGDDVGVGEMASRGRQLKTNGGVVRL